MSKIDRCRRNRQIVMISPRVREPLCKIAHLVVVNINESRDAVLALSGLVMDLLKSCAHQVTKGFRTALIGSRFDEAINFGHKNVVERHRYPLHQSPL